MKIRVNERLMKRDMALAKTAQSGGKEGLSMRISRESLMNAVRHEGREILTDAGDGYWKDMRRKYAHLTTNAQGRDTGESPDGTRNHFGLVSFRRDRNGWRKWDGAKREWVPCDPPPSRLKL